MKKQELNNIHNAWIPKKYNFSKRIDEKKNLAKEEEKLGYIFQQECYSHNHQFAFR